MDDVLTSAPSSEAPHWRRNRRVLIAAAVLLCVASIAGLALWYRAWNASPRKAIADIASSALRGDAKSIANLVDTEAIADNAVDDAFDAGMMQDPRISRLTSGGPPGWTREDYKAYARRMLDQEIAEHVEAGTLPRRVPIPGASAKRLLGGAAARTAVRSLEVRGDRAEVVVVVPTGGTAVRVELEMVRSGDSWKVTRVANLPDIFQQLK